MSRFAIVGFAMAVLVAGTTFDRVAFAEEGVETEVQQSVDRYNQAQESESQQVICRKEAVTGTRIKKTVCRSKFRVEQDQNAIERSLEKMRTQPIPRD